MFLRQRGRQVEVLHSYRNGRNQVRQRCLGRFRDRSSLDALWQTLSRQVPEWRSRLEELRVDAEALVSNESQNRPELRRQIRETAFRLLGLLTREGSHSDDIPEMQALRVLLRDSDGGSAEPEQALREEAERRRSEISPRRERFDTAEESAKGYLATLDHLADHLWEQGRQEEAVTTQASRAGSCSDVDAVSRHAHWLGQQGKYREASGVMEVLPAGDPCRNLNLAALRLAHGQYEAAFDPLLRGLAREPGLVDREHPYWKRFGYLWDENGSNVLQALFKLPLVRRQLHRAGGPGPRMRTLVKAFPRRWLIPTVLGQCGIPVSQKPREEGLPGSAWRQMSRFSQVDPAQK